jgi:hypothetical protein
LDTKELHQYLRVRCDRLRHPWVLSSQLLDQGLRVLGVGRYCFPECLDLGVVAQRVQVELLAACSGDGRRCASSGASSRLLLLLCELWKMG